MYEVIPAPLLHLLTWSELEERACGRPHIDVALLRRHTEYSGLTGEEPYVQWLWEILTEFSQPLRRKFIHFVWARERLPRSDRAFKSASGRVIRMMVKAGTHVVGNPDLFLPKSDTCFFNLQLPAYTSLAVMRKQLVTAITYSSGMDGDLPVAAANPHHHGARHGQDEEYDPDLDEPEDDGAGAAEGDEDVAGEEDIEEEVEEDRGESAGDAGSAHDEGEGEAESEDDDDDKDDEEGGPDLGSRYSDS
jgi:hypothetical protein